MKILSFIVPAYNVEKFVEVCIDSLIQRFVLHKTEIIIVNDGSSDKTAETVQMFCERYPDTVRLINQENRGHGGALNTGCAAAEGKYLKVIDADDTIRTENLPDFITFLENTESDVVLTHYQTYDVSTGKTQDWKCFPKEFGKELSIEDITADFKSFDKTFTFHGITYKTDFYQKNATPLAEKVFYEDHEFSTFPACRAKTVTVFDSFIYRYRIGDVSQSVSEENQLRRISHLEAVLFQMSNKYCALADSLNDGAKAFVAQKTAILLLSYLSTALLVEKNKPKGRKNAEILMEKMNRLFPKAVSTVGKKYAILKLLNRLHISKKTFDNMLSSKAYKRFIADKR